MFVYRISLATLARTKAAAFGGAGGIYGMGRWHILGQPIVYCSTHLSLAALEILGHLNRSTSIHPYVHYELEAPEAMVPIAAGIPPDWKNNVAATQAFGSAWLKAKTSPLLRVPSIHIDSEYNVLLNPAHADFTLNWVTRGPVEFKFDRRLTAP